MSERNGSPWPAPQSPPTRSLTWPAPTCETPSRLPDGTRVRTPNGSTGVIEQDNDGTYEVYSAQTGKTYQLTDRDLTRSRKRVKTAKANAGNQPGHYVGRLGVLWRQKAKPRLAIKDWRRPVRREGKWLDILLPGVMPTRTTSAHTPACDRRCTTKGGKVDHRSRRTPGCPGCKALR